MAQWTRFDSGEGEAVGDKSGKGANLLSPGAAYTNWRDSGIEIIPMNEKVKNLLSSQNTEQNKGN